MKSRQRQLAAGGTRRAARLVRRLQGMAIVAMVSVASICSAVETGAPKTVLEERLLFGDDWLEDLAAFQTRPQDRYQVALDMTRGYGTSSRLRITREPDTEIMSSAHFVRRPAAAIEAGDEIRLSLGASVENAMSQGRVMAWLRIEDEEGRVVYATNSDASPIRPREWQRIEIAVRAPPTSRRMVYGIICHQIDKTWIDDIKLTVIRGTLPDAWNTAHLSDTQLASLRDFASAYGIARFYYPDETWRTSDWHHFLASIALEILQAKALPRTWLARAFWRQGILLSSGRRPARKAPYKSFAYHGYPSDTVTQPQYFRQQRSETLQDIGARGGSLEIEVPKSSPKLRIPIALSTVWEVSHPQFPDRREVPTTPLSSPATRIALVIELAATLSHVVWYADDVDEAQVTKALQIAASGSEAEFRAAVEAIAYSLHDGHVRLKWQDDRTSYIPGIDLCRDPEGRFVVREVAKGLSAAIPVGSVVTTIDGQGIADLAGGLVQRSAGGTVDAKWNTAGMNALAGERGTRVQLGICDIGEHCTIKAIPRTRSMFSPLDSRPVTQALGDGVHYLDLRRATPQAASSFVESIRGDKGLIVDLRGRPLVGPSFFQTLVDRTISVGKMDVPIVPAPFKRGMQFEALPGWVIEPASNHVSLRLAFLIDDRTLSYPETLAEMFRRERVGILVGTRTAAGNGNITSTSLPGGATLLWSGMRVSIEGSQSILGKGVEPNHTVGCVRSTASTAPDVVDIARQVLH